jgi:saccharopine dehydrogenase (NAD+, L-lysine-forming)
MDTWMLYGANGYTGRLIAEVAERRGLEPILAGRNREAIEELAHKHSMPSRVFPLEKMKDNLEGVSAVLLAAGPFVHTSAKVSEACMAAGIHYLDITGEIDVFEALHGLDSRAKAAGSVILPGVGFDVVPSDCLAASLAKALPEATELELAFSGGSVSKGTAKTMLMHIGDGGAIRENGEIKNVPMGYHSKDIDFADKSRHCMTIPWGDVSTAYRSTGIGNIRVYSGASKSRVKQAKAIKYLVPLLQRKLVQRQLSKLIDARVKGPDAAERASRKTELWGEVRDPQGNSVQGTLTVGEGYSLTAECAVEAVTRVASAEPGFQTPSTAFGPSFITEFDGCTLRVGV